jgi:hypothetical protein
MMLVAHRNGMAVWTNPYVTDGLVAMWDGEWNAGGGVHDDTLTAWEDIISGYTLYQRNNSWTWDANSFGCSARDELRPRYSGNYEAHPAWQAAGAAGTWTVEIVPKAAGPSCIHSKWVLNTSSFGYFRFGLDTATRYSDTSAIGKTIGSWVISRTGELVKTYWNGVPSLNLTVAGDQPTSSGVVTINGTTGSSGNANCRYHAFRIYSSALTAEEIAANYAIDKRRFNLT